MKSWKTTIAGVLTILVALGNAGLALLHGGEVDWAILSLALTTGVGLLKAKDETAR